MGVKENFPEGEIREQLKRILSSSGFKNSRVLCGFLQFVVEEAISGRDQEIKEYTIALHVLSKDSDFNPQLDGIVRIHAGRLRRALKEYYYEVGQNDPIWIEIPKGSYIPLFQSPIETENTGIRQKNSLARNRPVVALLPFRNISKDSSRDFFADGLGEQLSTELSRFQDLSVISYYSSRNVANKTSDIKKAASLLGAKYIVTGSIQNDDNQIRISVQLISAEHGEQLWTNSFDRKNTASGLLEIQHEIVRNILTAIGGYYGAIFRDVMNTPHNSSGNGIEIYDALFWYYHYQKVFTKEVFEKTINALEAAVKADPNYALAWAMLGEIYLDDKANEFKKIENPAEEGLKCALRAVSIDPNCQHGYMALGWIYLFHHNREESLVAAEKAIAINPNSADAVGAMGFVFVCAGEFDRGLELLNDSVQHNPYCPWWFYVGYIFYFLYKKDYRNALHWAEKVNSPELFWDPLLRAVAFGHLDRSEDAGKNLQRLIKILPDTYNQVKEVIESFLLSQELQNEILEGLRKAGLKSEQQPDGLKVENNSYH